MVLGGSYGPVDDSIRQPLAESDRARCRYRRVACRPGAQAPRSPCAAPSVGIARLWTAGGMPAWLRSRNLWEIGFAFVSSGDWTSHSPLQLDAAVASPGQSRGEKPALYRPHAIASRKVRAVGLTGNQGRIPERSGRDVGPARGLRSVQGRSREKPEPFMESEPGHSLDMEPISGISIRYCAAATFRHDILAPTNSGGAMLPPKEEWKQFGAWLSALTQVLRL